MSLNCGIVGLPNVGKSTLFQALTSAPAEAANYPFCTIDPNVGIVNVPDRRLEEITKRIPTEKVVPAVCEFVDIAGLVRGASRGEGLGNKFLANIRETGVILHVVRCFDNNDIIHVENKIDPRNDIEIINLELALADLDTVEKRYEKNIRVAKAKGTEAGKIAEAQQAVLEKLRPALENGAPVRSVPLTEDEVDLIRDLHLITAKKVLYVCNVDEAGLSSENDYVKKTAEIAAAENADYVVICGKLESEIAALDTPEERAEFLDAAGLTESGLDRLIQKSYALLGLRTFFTAGPKEVRAWTFKEGYKAPQAAGVIHSDFERGFIKADIYTCDDLFQYGSEAAVRQAGKLRTEGREYIVRDGDIVFFKFNV
ncbi:MAG: redox-regulated ATPase YchF [Spirochaetia bacterium]|nr:redox-regulated ATPase YchF [Spirochaetia bacterium]